MVRGKDSEDEEGYLAGDRMAFKHSVGALIRHNVSHRGGVCVELIRRCFSSAIKYTMDDLAC